VAIDIMKIEKLCKSLWLTLYISVASCTATSVAIEPQSKSRDPRYARLFFLREEGFVGFAGRGPISALRVTVDKKEIGSIVAGSYIFVDRPPGRHALGIIIIGSETTFETEVQVAAGENYYFEIGFKHGGLRIDDIRREAYGSVGTPMPAIKESPGFMFNQIDALRGEEEVKKLTVSGRSMHLTPN
jgi:hypothetical protein